MLLILSKLNTPSLIHLFEIKTAMHQGMTKPLLCKGNDEQQYVVKRLNAGLEGCIYEWVASRIGRLFGINIPPSEQVWIDRALFKYSNDLQITLGEGIGFASRYHSSLSEITFQQLKKVDKQTLLDLFVFDYWIKNDDRTLTENGGNPNLFQDVCSKELVVIDHNLAFDESFDVAAFKRTHVSSYLLPEPIAPISYESRMHKAVEALPDILSEIPDEWLDDLAHPNQVLDKITSQLMQYKQEEFWEALR